MEKLVESGLVRSIGVSNFNSEQIDRLLAHCKIKPVTNQVEVGPSITQKKLTKFCKERDIVITGYSPLGRPYNVGRNPNLPPIAFLDPRVIAIGEKYKKTGAQVVLRYLVCWNHKKEKKILRKVIRTLIPVSIGSGPDSQVIQ